MCQTYPNIIKAFFIFLFLFCFWSLPPNPLAFTSPRAAPPASVSRFFWPPTVNRRCSILFESDLNPPLPSLLHYSTSAGVLRARDSEGDSGAVARFVLGRGVSVDLGVSCLHSNSPNL